MPSVRTAEECGVPAVFNAADGFVDRHLREGRADHSRSPAATTEVTYGQLAERVNRCGNALRDIVGVRRGDRVLCSWRSTAPSSSTAFFGAIKDRCDPDSHEHAVEAC